MKTIARIAPSTARVRRLPRWTVAWVAVMSVSIGAGGNAWAETCQDAAQPVLEALKARDLEAAGNRFEVLETEFGCSDTYRARVARAISNLHADIVLERMELGAGVESQREVLERGLYYARTWLTLALAGDAAHEAKDYPRAAELYQDALVDINNETDNPDAPPWSTIEKIHRRAWQSRMLARSFVATPVNRAGEPDGLAAPTFRGLKVDSVPIPITFDFDSARFDDPGRRYAEEMAEHLLQQRPARIVITAHTDPEGPASYNLDLSRRRGEAVVEFLQARLKKENVRVAIEMIPKGESKPIPLDLNEYDEDERMRMHRRVELRPVELVQ